MRQLLKRLLTLSILFSPIACNGGITGPSLEEADLRILFVGNSLTYSNEMPLLLETIADHQGLSVSTAMVAAPNFSLEDHWHTGVADVIRDLNPDVVIMQQGPSSLPQNQVYLREWAERVSEVITEVGATPALMMVWPDLNRLHAFDAVQTSYLDAAIAVNGDFIPTGEVFRALIAIPGYSPIGLDLFHPSYLGSVAAAASILRFYFPEALEGLPNQIAAPVGTDHPPIQLSVDQANTVWAVVENVLTDWGR